MALKYGTNFLASDIAKGLEKNNKQKEGIRTWSQLFGNASLGFGAQSDAITSNYASAMREAYTANFNQRNKILTGGLSQGYTQQALGLSQQDLSDIYERFVTNYSKDINTAAQSYGSEVSAISGDLTDRAENFSKLFSSAYDYLSSELYGSYLTDRTDFSTPIYELDEKGKETDKLLGYNQRQLDYLEEKGLDWLYVGEGEERRLMTWEEASALLFDEDGELTEEGVRFYDQMFNARPEGYLREDGTTSIRSFDQWLSDTDAELRDWWLSSDDFNYNFAGTNRGTANIMTGRESTDFKEDMPETTLLNAKRTGYDNFVKKFSENSKLVGLNDQTWYDKSISGDLKKSFKNKTFNEFLEASEKLVSKGRDNNFWTSGASDDTVQAYAQGIEKYIREYQKAAADDISTFKSEITSMLGAELANAFWQEYGGSLEKLYEQVSTWKTPERKTRSKLHGWDDESANDWLDRMNKSVRNLQALGLDKEFAKLQEKLKIYIEQKYTERKKSTKPSGF